MKFLIKLIGFICITLLFGLFFSTDVFAETLTWTLKTDMSTARQTPAVVATNNGKIYAIGGYNGNSLATNEEYDIATNTWVTKTSMPTARHNLAATPGSNGRIYVIGGYNGSNPVATVEEYDPATDTWTTKASMPTARHALAVATASNGKIYAVGGNDNTIVSILEEYNPATDTWTTKASMPTARYALTFIPGSNGKLYAIGGFSAVDPNNENKVEEYDPATDTWTTKASMPTRRTGPAGAVDSNGYIYVIGGYNGGYDMLSTVERYDPITNIWTTETNMLTARILLGAALGSNGKIYAIGGYGPNGITGTNLATVEEATIVIVAPTATSTPTPVNVAPVVGAITAPTAPVVVGSLVNVSANFTDANTSDTHTASWDWGDGLASTGSVTESNGSGNVTGSHIYLAAGVYEVTLTVTDNYNASDSEVFQYISVYNPTPQGLFTGVRLFNSPQGAYVANPNLTGQVQFGVTAKYQGTGINGDVGMNFNAANFEFNSTSLTVFVTSNGKATLRGTGTINGSGDYTFLVTGFDGGSGQDDFVRFQIKNSSATVVYDSQIGAADSVDPTTLVTAGQVIVH